MPRGRHSAPPEHHVARAVVGSTAVAGLASGGFLAITPEQVRADLAASQPDTRPMQRVQVAATEPAAATSSAVQYVVKARDTLSGIGGSFREPWRTLYADNVQTIGPDPDVIQPGQTLLLESGPPTAPIPMAVPAQAVTPAAVVTPAATTGRHRAVIDGLDVVAQAHAYLGVPYAWGGSTRAGMDCSGLVLRVFADLGVAQLPHSSAAQSGVGVHVGSMAQAQPGDLLFFDNPVGHVAIYIGGGQMIAAPTFGEHVKVQAVYTAPTVIRRLV